MDRMDNRPLSIKVIVAFATVYIVWGSTYLANEYAIDFMPPWMMAGSRFTTAGLLLVVFTRLVGWQKTTPRQWLHAYILGVLFMTLGVGGTVWAQQFVDSGTTSLLVGMTPLMVLLVMWVVNRKRPRTRAFVGVFISLGGMALLVNQAGIISEPKALLGVIAILACGLCWACGSVNLPRMQVPQSKLQSAGMQMLCGGGTLLIIALLSGEYGDLSLKSIAWQSWLAWGYLILFGSIAAFTAFNYLLSHVSPDKVSTSAYVNPVIAVFLGWFLRDELLTGQTIVAAFIMLTGVYFINTTQRRTIHIRPLRSRLPSFKSGHR